MYNLENACEICSARGEIKTVKYSNNKVVKRCLCEHCYSMLGCINEKSISLINLNENIINNGHRCEVCGLNLDEIDSIKEMGCPECYRLFKKTVYNFFKKGCKRLKNAYYKGKRPVVVKKQRLECYDNILRLEKMIAVALKSEKYEDAANLNKRLKFFQKKSTSLAV